MAPERGFNGGNMVPSNRFHAGRCAVTRYSGRLHEPVGQSYRLLALCPAPTDPVGQSWRVDMHACMGVCRNTYTCKYALV